MVLLNCAIDSASVYPTYTKPFEIIFERAKREEWSGRADLNCDPSHPKRVLYQAEPRPDYKGVTMEVPPPQS